MVVPKLVYISQPTEKGTIYSKQELTQIYETCKKLDLYLYIDGARLGAALTSKYADIKPQDLSHLCDAFYIGGTKNGSPLGEALCIINDKLKPNFRKFIKQHGALLAKGYLVASCFKTLFTDDLFFKLAAHANEMAQKIADALGTSTQSNLVFANLPNSTIDKLKQHFDFFVIEPVDDNNSTVRFVTSWATQQDAVENLVSRLF